MNHELSERGFPLFRSRDVVDSDCFYELPEKFVSRVTVDAVSPTRKYIMVVRFGYTLPWGLNDLLHRKS